jgi:hypothetical protein
MVYIICQERGKKRKISNNHRQQSDHRKLLHATLHGKGHSGASKKTMEGLFWPPGGITHAA